MARSRVKLNLAGIREMKNSIDDSFLQGVGEEVAARARTAGENVAHGGVYPVHVEVSPRRTGKVVVVICPVPWAMAIEAKHGVLAKALG